MKALPYTGSVLSTQIQVGQINLPQWTHVFLRNLSFCNERIALSLKPASDLRGETENSKRRPTLATTAVKLGMDCEFTDNVKASSPHRRCPWFYEYKGSIPQTTVHPRRSFLMFTRTRLPRNYVRLAQATNQTMRCSLSANAISWSKKRTGTEIWQFPK